MSLSLQQLREAAKAVVALAAMELFPGTLLVGGGVDEITFFYDLIFSEKIIQVFSFRELEQLEDRMRHIVVESRPMKTVEMMRENASDFLRYQGQPLRAEEAALTSLNIVSLIQIGNFYDLSPPSTLIDTSSLKTFKLLGFEVKAQGVIRITGTAFSEKEELKEFLKKYKVASKNDPITRGIREKFFILDQGESILLPKGEEVLNRLIHLWRTLHHRSHFALIHVPLTLSQAEAHLLVLKEKIALQVASFCPSRGDLATRLASREQLFERLISSLQFIQEAFKIFGFEIVIHSSAQIPCLVKAFEHLEIKFKDEARIKGKECVTFHTFDGYGRTVKLSLLEIDEKNRVIHHSLFYSLKNWISLCIERGVDKIEFEGQ